jgi:peptidoglycan/LPS O-acetylase OafA/YrhL
MSGSQAETFGVKPEEHTTELQPATESTGKYNLGVAYLRTFVVVLVVAVHSFIAYLPLIPHPLASLRAMPRAWELFPVVDSQRWVGSGLLVGFGDTCFMALFFFLSGLFVWNSLVRKGSGVYLRDRFLRLGLPFVAAAALVAPLAYYPAYLQTGANPSPAAYGREWLSLGEWWVGPAWFVWVLLAFDCVAVLCLRLMPRSIEAPALVWRGELPSPAASFALLIAVSAAAYLPLLRIFGPIAWARLGTFFFQTSRLLHYAVYFTAGVFAGAYGIKRGLLAPDGKLAQRWRAWTLAALVAYSFVIIVAILATTSRISLRTWETLGGFAFVLSCAASGFAFLSIFLRFVRARGRIFDSLTRNIYGIYLIHIVFVTWLQYGLLRAQMPPIAKGSIVFLSALTLSWGAVAALRRLPAVARVI